MEKCSKSFSNSRIKEMAIKKRTLVVGMKVQLETIDKIIIPIPWKISILSQHSIVPTQGNAFHLPRYIGL